MGKGKRNKAKRLANKAPPAEGEEIIKKPVSHISTTRYYFLKYIAMITMVIDHTAYLLDESLGMSQDLYVSLRMIGRIAFPLFAYMLVEAFFFTKNRGKHCRRILGLALLSEIPFNVFKEVKILTLAYQNVCFELAIGFLLLCILNRNSDTFWLMNRFKSKKARKFFTFVAKFDLLVIFFTGVTMFNIDYEWRGLILIIMLYIAKKSKHHRIWQLLALAAFGVSFLDWIYLMVIADLILIYLVESNCIEKLAFGKIGTKIKNGISKGITGTFSKVLCRTFYPVHLVILIAIRLAFA